MAINPQFTKRVRDMLGTKVSFEEKKMFSGVAFMVHGKMCVTVGDTRLMCRIDPTTHQELTKQEGVATVKMKGRNYIGWVYVNESKLLTKKNLEHWVQLCLAYNEKIKDQVGRKRQK